eukprot:TRINITY_DN7955_c0_g1_i1.p1 TRINITY_DN7955_c0_g1~~TRINITY_DN7955_c0_g1_i1.p1  ORF type:complete len:562 (+),score=121.23 TRINITY_DN7955_c0_g1_i1:71-1756(+)
MQTKQSPRTGILRNPVKEPTVTSGPECPHCEDTGMLPFRFHKFMGVWSESSEGIPVPQDYPFLLEDTPKAIYQQLLLTLCHIFKSSHESLEATTKEATEPIVFPATTTTTTTTATTTTTMTTMPTTTTMTTHDLTGTKSSKFPKQIEFTTTMDGLEECLKKLRSKKYKDIEVVEFLRKYGPSLLSSKYAVDVSKHEKYNNLLHFSYSQVSSDLNLKMIKQCRGIILDSKNDWRVVAYPYNKFFNFGEACADEIDWSTAVVSEKIDGSIAVLYWYGDEWHVSTSSTADGHGLSKASTCDRDDEKLTIFELFWQIWKKLNYRLPQDKDCTYMFEILSPRHPIIVVPQKETLYLHGVRDNISGTEIDPGMVACFHGWECVPFFAFSKLEEVLDVARQLVPTQHEGFVVRDANWRRVKVKTPQYVALSQLSLTVHEDLNSKHMLEIVRTNEGDEFLAHFPKYSELFTHVNGAFNSFMNDVDSNEQHHESELYRTFQSLGSNNFREYLSSCDIDMLWNFVQSYLPNTQVEVVVTPLEREKEGMLRKQQRRAKKNLKSRQGGESKIF